MCGSVALAATMWPVFVGLWLSIMYVMSFTRPVFGANALRIWLCCVDISWFVERLSATRQH